MQGDFIFSYFNSIAITISKMNEVQIVFILRIFSFCHVFNELETSVDVCTTSCLSGVKFIGWDFGCGRVILDIAVIYTMVMLTNPGVCPPANMLKKINNST